MVVFLTQQVDTNEKLRTQLGWVKSELAAVWIAVANVKNAMRELQERVQATKIEACHMEKEKKKAAEAKCKYVKQERDQLKKKLENLRAASEVQKKQLEELWAGFTIEKEALTEDYQN